MRRLVSEPLRRLVNGPPETTLREGLVGVALGFIFGLVGVFCVHVFSQRATIEQEPDTGPGEAVAALAGVIVGIGGTEIGHATSVLRTERKKTLQCHHVGFDWALGLVAAGAILGALSLLLADKAWLAAVATLLVAAIGVPWVHLHHERLIPQGGDIVLGLTLAVAAPIVALVIIASLSQYAEAAATIAVALVGVGATLLSHGRGLQRQADLRMSGGHQSE
jgi:hypothetical protein